MARDVKAHRGLTTERVVDAALRAADEGGLEAVSLRRLAAALEVTPMAIYRHVRNKSHLLDLMVERLLDQVDLAPAETATWQDRLRRLLASFQAKGNFPTCGAKSCEPNPGRRRAEGHLHPHGALRGE